MYKSCGTCKKEQAGIELQDYLDYCCLAYFDKLEIGQMNELVALQKQAVRLIFRAKKKNTHTSPLFKLSGILPISKQYEYEATKYVFKYNNELSRENQPKAIKDLFRL